MERENGIQLYRRIPYKQKAPETRTEFPLELASDRYFELFVCFPLSSREHDKKIHLVFLLCVGSQECLASDCGAFVYFGDFHRPRRKQKQKILFTMGCGGSKDSGVVVPSKKSAPPEVSEKRTQAHVSMSSYHLFILLFIHSK